MKIWEVLTQGQNGEVFKATNTIPSWEGVTIMKKFTGSGSAAVILEGTKIPDVDNPRLGKGRALPLLGAVTRADWVSTGVKDYPGKGHNNNAI